MKNCSNSGQIIKIITPLVVLFFCFTSPLVVVAESVIQGNIINAPTKIDKSTNVAAGSDNKARQFSVALKDSRMNGTVVNSVLSKNAVNVAAGKRNVANQGSVSIYRGDVKGLVVNSAATKSTTNMAVGNRNQAHQSAIIIKKSSVSGKVINSSVGNSKINMAVGTNNKANQGTVLIENSRIRGTVMNNSTIQKSTNMAVGNGNSASQAAIVIGGGVQLRGNLVNNSTSENSVNAAVGYNNEASQSSIVVDGNQAGSESAQSVVQNNFRVDSGKTGKGVVNLLPISRVSSKQGATSTLAKPAQHVPGQVVFLIDNDKAGLASLDRVAQKYHLNVGEKTVLKSLNRIMVVSSTTKDAAEVAEALKNESGVYKSQPNYVFKTLSANDPMSPMQNLVSMLDLQDVHTKVSGKNIIVAIVDTGVDIEHQDLRSRIIGHQNFIPTSVYRGEIHGTAVAGIIGAEKNEYGILGIAPDVSLLALRACRQISKMSAMGECFSTSLVRSLDAAISAKVDVANLSLGADVNDALLSAMIDSGHERGVIFVAPVGNDPAAVNIAFPASHDKVISIAGLDELGNPLPNKQLASMADAVAPATHLFVTTPGDSYNFVDGTSLASASISGIIVLSMGKKNGQISPCLPHFSSAIPWSKQVFSCIGL